MSFKIHYSLIHVEKSRAPGCHSDYISFLCFPFRFFSFPHTRKCVSGHMHKKVPHNREFHTSLRNCGSTSQNLFCVLLYVSHHSALRRNHQGWVTFKGHFRIVVLHNATCFLSPFWCLQFGFLETLWASFINHPAFLSLSHSEFLYA